LSLRALTTAPRKASISVGDIIFLKRIVTILVFPISIDLKNQLVDTRFLKDAKTF